MPRGTEHAPKTTWPPKEPIMDNGKRLLTAISPAGNLTFPNADSPAQRDSDARHDALIAHEQREIIRKLAFDLADLRDHGMTEQIRMNIQASLEHAKLYLDYPLD